jgi:hypothetical protein
MIVFGGVNSTMWLGDTWRLSLSSLGWTNLQTGPPARLGHVAVLDPVSQRMFVFGGDPPDPQTWRFALTGPSGWTVEPTNGPTSLNGATAIYDAARHRGVMSGGNNGGTYGNEAWELKFSPSGATWHALAPDGSLPPGRSYAASVYDVLRDRMLVFGGLNGLTFIYYRDLRSLQWQEALDLDPTAEPSRLSLAPPWPNPSSVGVAIPFTMPSAGRARVRLYDVHGRFVRQLLDGPVAAGAQWLRWDRRTAAGAMSRAGVYFVELQAAGERRTQRIVATD